MAAYTENDVQNALINIRNGGALATAFIYHGVLQITLCDCLNSARFCQNAHNGE